MEQKLDLRIQKTYLALTQAFLQMMKEKPLEDIRIGELCERAMIRKSTFYKHFGDKYELLAFIVRQTQEKFNAQLKEKYTEGSVVDRYMELITLVFDYIGENKELFESAIQSNSFPLILSILSEQIISDIQQQLQNDAISGETLPASPNLLAAFFVGGVMEIVYRQLRKGNSLNDPELLRQIQAILNQFYQPLNGKESS